MNIKECFDIYFDLVKDPRSQTHITYKLSDILFLLIVGMLCNCTDLKMIIEFAEEKEEFLKKYTELKSIPCLSTMSNILKIINPDHLELCLYGIFSNVLKCKMKIEENQICIDGKTTTEKLLSYTRKHWQVESFHWLLDMNYNEDEMRVE